MCSYLTVCTVALMALATLACCNAQTEMKDTIPQRCTNNKPKTGDCAKDGEEIDKVRRYFLHSTKGCKPSGYCPEDIPVLDRQDNLNYFVTIEDCIQTCIPHIQCPQLEPIQNGSVSNNGEGFWGITVTYSCNEGFNLVGDKERLCQKDATWNTDTSPVCKPKCSVPKEAGPVTPQQDYYNPNDQVVIGCPSGFIGSVRRTCLENGTWTQEEANCQRKVETCELPKIIQNGRDPMAPSLSVGSIVTYGCKEGFIMSGESTRQCLPDLTWSGEEPMCWRLTIEAHLCEGENPTVLNHPYPLDITNQSYSIPDMTNDICFRSRISEPNPFQDLEPSWNYTQTDKVKSLDVVSDDGNLLKIEVVTTGTMENKMFIATISKYQVFFTIQVTEVTEAKSQDDTKPMNKYHTSLVEHQTGENATLLCIFEALPASNVDWIHENIELQSNTDGRVAIKTITRNHTKPATEPALTLSTLSINMLTETDFGKYYCVGYNREGNDNETSEIKPKSDGPSKRSAAGAADLTNDPETVTFVGRVRHTSPDYKSPLTTLYKVSVVRIISQSTVNPLPLRKRSRSIKTLVVSADQLDRNGVYIFKGKVSTTSKIVITDSVVKHSNELEQSLRQS